MKVPNREAARIDRRKVKDYLLSPAHPDGRGKCALFLRLGYSRERWGRLATDLRWHLRTQTLVAVVPGPYGAKYVVHGTVRGPSGAIATIVAVWIVNASEDFPRLVTAYPGEPV